MPHYKNGRTSQVGDYVIGTGYNLKASDGQPLVFAGVVLAIKESEACNITVLVHRAVPFAQALSESTGSVYRTTDADGTFITDVFEFGACKDFLHAEDALNAGSPRIVTIEPPTASPVTIAPQTETVSPPPTT